MTPKPSIWIDPVRNRKGKVTSWRVCWRIPGMGRGSKNTGPLKPHAEAEKRKLEEQAWEGKLQLRPRSGEYSFAELLARFETDRRPDLSKRTWEIYQTAAAKFRAKLGAEFPIAQFDLDQAAKLKSYLSGELGLERNTVSLTLRHLSAIFSYGVRPLKWITDHGLLDLEIPSYRRNSKIIQPDWLRDLVKYAPARARAPMWILPHVGMRPGELINLQHPQLDRAASYAKVMRHVDLGLGSDWDRKTKNEVHVPIDAGMWRWFGPVKESGWVFEGYNQTDPQERTRQFAKDWRRARRAANEARARDGRPPIPEITPHHSKHTFVTRALEAGLRPQVVADITGTNLQTLIRTYRAIINRAPISEAGHVTFGEAPISAPTLPQQGAGAVG
jgi:integrase